jgi:hypothetical protein
MKTNLFIIALFALACSRGPEGSAEGDCADKKDNDADGRYDCDDDGCASDDYCVKLARKIREEEEAKSTALKEAAKAKAEAEEQPDLGPYFELDDILVQSGTNGKEINWYGAEEYCRGLALAGRAKWRLPTSEEALKIVKSGKFANDPSSYVMWTSTKEGKKLALIVGITEGAVNPLPMQFDGECRARCVMSLDK